MKEDEREGEDVAGLFRRFGGDASGYQEFEPAPEAAAAPGTGWALLPGSGPGTAPDPVSVAPSAATAQAMPAPLSTAAPAGSIASIASIAPVAPVVPTTSPAPPQAFTVQAAPAISPIAAAFRAPPAPPTSDSTHPGDSPRELDRLFARLAGQPKPGAEASLGLMARWRKPS